MQVFIFKVLLLILHVFPPFTTILIRPQECEIHTRAKDANSATAAWFSELLSTTPWFKDIVPNVCFHPHRTPYQNNTLLTPTVPHHSSLLPPPRDHLRHSLHLRLYQHRHLSPLAPLSMPQKRCNLPPRFPPSRPFSQSLYPSFPFPNHQLHRPRRLHPRRHPRHLRCPRSRANRSRP